MLDYMRQIANAAPYLFPKAPQPGSSNFPPVHLRPSTPTDERIQGNLTGAMDLASLSKTDYLSRKERVSFFLFHYYFVE